MNFPVGISTVTYTGIDDAGNESDPCTFDVWIKNILDPNFEVICLTGEDATIRVPAEPGLCQADVTVLAPQINNQCVEVFSITYQINSEPAVSVPAPAPAAGITTLDPLSETFNVGVHTVTWVITDASGNEYTCEQTVEVTDVNSILTCPSSIERPVDPGEVFATLVATGSPIITENCAEPRLIWELEPPVGFESEYEESERSGTGIYTEETFWLGVTTITYSLTDAAGNVLIDGEGNPISCSFTVTVTNQPEITCPPSVTFTADENCEYPFNPGVPTLTQGSQPLDWTYTIYWPDAVTEVETGVRSTTSADPIPDPIVAADPHEYPFQIGTTTITWTVEDQFGNTATCSHTITVEDNDDPTVELPDPLNECVENLFFAQYSGIADILIYNPDYPHPYPTGNPDGGGDYYLFEAGDESLDISNYQDNCCGYDEDDISWVIQFDGTEPDISGTGLPSDYGDIKLWGDGVNFLVRHHVIIYTITDCNENTVTLAPVEITIRPRPKIEKVP
jgi:hypothetical protein